MRDRTPGRVEKAGEGQLSPAFFFSTTTAHHKETQTMRYLAAILSIVFILVLAESATLTADNVMQQAVLSLWNIRAALYFIAAVLVCICWDIGGIAENIHKLVEMRKNAEKRRVAEKKQREEEKHNTRITE